MTHRDLLINQPISLGLQITMWPWPWPPSSW